MADPVFFTIEGDYKAVVADIPEDVDADPELGPVTATVTFTPLLLQGDVLLAVTASPRPTGFVPAPIVGRIDTDGRVKLRVDVDGATHTFANVGLFPGTGTVGDLYIATNTDTSYRWTGSAYVETVNFTPVRLLADTPLLELDTPLYYSVAFTNVRFNGKTGIIKGFTFQAPTSDTPVNLIQVGRVPGAPPGAGVLRGPAGPTLWWVEVVGGYQQTDGTTLYGDVVVGLTLVGGGGGGGGVANIVEDLTPQLGGNLDQNGYQVGSATPADIDKLHAITKSAAQINSVATSATANATDAQLRDRATHTGVQLAATISDFAEATGDAVSALLVEGSGIALVYNDTANTLTISGGSGPARVDNGNGTGTFTGTGFTDNGDGTGTLS